MGSNEIQNQYLLILNFGRTTHYSLWIMPCQVLWAMGVVLQPFQPVKAWKQHPYLQLCPCTLTKNYFCNYCPLILLSGEKDPSRPSKQNRVKRHGLEQQQATRMLFQVERVAKTCCQTTTSGVGGRDGWKVVQKSTT